MEQAHSTAANSTASQKFDFELTAADIQGIAGAEQLAAFFTRLGYNTTARMPQTTANLQLSEAVARPIRRIELLADNDRLLQVYFFELSSVTVANIRALARAFRNFAGNFLLVLTADYEQLDFVLLKRELPSAEGQLGVPQAAIVPRRFTVNRRRAGPVELRVLRRLTWTEPHAIDQIDKLSYAFDVAHWSEAWFNNRALFSDYFLLHRLPARETGQPEFPEWLEDPKPAYQKLRGIYSGPAARFAGKRASELSEMLYEPLLRELGFEVRRSTQASAALLRLGDPSRPDETLAVCLAYPWGRELDRKDETRDAESPEVTPAFAVVELLATEPARWVILTNGRIWRLYSQRAHSRATNYYEVDLDEVLGRQRFQQDVQDAFRYFWLLFRMPAFRPASRPDRTGDKKEEREWEGRKRSLSMLDRLLLGSQQYAKELGESLKRRVFEEVFPHLAEGFIANIRRREGDGAQFDEERLAEIYQATLTLLYRLLFLLYSESRDLLPLRTSREYFDASLGRTKEEIAKVAGPIADETERKIRAHYSDDTFSLWKRLKALFTAVDQGSEDLNVPRYNGGLFQAERDPDDDSAEARAARFLERERIADRYLARALDLLARGLDPKRLDLVPTDYKSLGVRQLGSIYEGLLEFRLRIAGEKLAIVKEKGREVYVRFRELDERSKERAERRDEFVSRGRAYLENDKRERKATGSYYTPDHIVEYIVKHAVGPVLSEKLDALRPKLRDAQHRFREFWRQQEEFGRCGMKPKPIAQADLIGREVVDELFNIKVLDPAMGSGHFLVEAVDFITDRILEFLNAFPWNPVQVHLRLMRETIGKEMESQNVEVDENRLTDVNLLKRHVLKRCIYGVDLNPMAVELAKVSLWLDCFTLGAPLSFLDHHLRCGNSLIGVTVEEVREELEGKGIGKDAGDARAQFTLFGSRFAGLLLATDLMRHVGELSDITGAQVEESRAEYRRAVEALAPFKRILDVYTAQWFVDSESSTGKREHPLVDFLKNREAEQLISARSSDEFRKAKRELAAADRRLMEQALRTAEDKKLFHWELEFPEAFFGPRQGTRNAVERLENAGFDAVIGNPPYIRVQELRRSDPDTADYVSARFNSAVKNFDLYLPFLERGLQLTTGQVSYIAPSKWFSTDYGAGLRKTAAEKKSLARVVDYGDYQIFEDVTNYTCICFLRSKPADTYIYVEAHRGELGPEQVRDGAALASDGSPWNFASGVEAALLARLAAKYPKLSEFRDRAFQGLRTSDNDVYVLTTDGRPRGGVLPVVSRATDDTHEIEKELLKPLLSGEQIRAFSLTHSGQYILFPYDLKGSKPELLSERRLRTDYPGAWRYLKACEKRLRAREQGKMDGPGWWAYGRNQNLDQFEQPKVMLPGYNDKPSAGLDLAGHFYHVSGYSLTLKEDAPIDLKVLAALLNSRLLYWFLAKTGVALQRGFVEFRPQYLDRLPIAVPKAGQRSSLDHLVDRAIRKGLAEIESELNALVGEMYEVSQEEMTILAGHRVVSSASRT